MGSDKYTQRAGEGSQQVQANTIVINNNSGIEEKRAREIFMEMFNVARKDLTDEALTIATQRVTEFENRLIPRMQQFDGAMNAFADPSFQLLLTNAHKTAASTERLADYSLLSELLIHRIQKGDNRKVRTGISRAIEIVDEISDEALLGLTVSFAAEKYVPASGKILVGLDTLNSLFKKLCYSELPLADNWLEHLDILDAIRMSTGQKLRKFEDFYCLQMPGYCVVGIKRNSDKYTTALELLQKSDLPASTLIQNELNDEYARLPIVNLKNIENQNLAIFEEAKLLRNIEFTDEQKQTLHQIYAMYESDDTLLQEIKEKFTAEIAKRPFLNQVRQWWNQIPMSYNITAVGRVLAHANARRRDGSIPDFD